MARWQERIYAMELKSKLVLMFLMIAIIPLASLGTFSYRKASNEIESKTDGITLENLSQVNHSLTYFVDDVEQLSTYIYSNEQIQTILSKPASRSLEEKYNDEKTMNQILNSFLGFKSWDIELYVLGANGERYFTGELLPNDYRDYNPNWGLFRKAKGADGGVVWDTHYSLKTIEDYGAVLSCGRMLKSFGSNESLGYLVIDIMEPALADKYDKVLQYPGGETYLLDSSGYVISSTPSKVQVGTLLNKSYVSEVLSGKKGYFHEEDGATDKVVIYDTSEATRFKVVSAVPVKALTQESASIRNFTIFIILSGMLVSYCLAYLLADYLTMPLRKLRYLMKQVERGFLDVSFSSKYKDEVGQLGSSFNQMIHRIKQLIDQVYEKQLKVQEAEIKAIQAQFTPHFLYNALDSINWMARIHGIDAISRTAISLGDLLRFSIHRGNHIIPFREDFKQINNYLTIQRLRHGDKIEMELELEDEILELYTPKLLIQPLVENAVIHGLEMKDGPGRLRITGSLEKEFVCVTVEDDGIGFELDGQGNIAVSSEPAMGTPALAHTGIGLSNLKHRLKLHFGDTYHFEMTSSPSLGTKVCIRIPVMYSAQEGNRYV
ncbi:histidine kinase [Bacillus sp. FJAT-27264]|uniref:cache domain-containing sensor histidine kinase n=1 Tax=Paenibacillus sp. (strain DSM 101736 / FJAT-27264) TaxID=1850362 RepID=UPI000807C9E7|nr:sensor histidine kinase [Bacillus sp. FJAT-27264]OBZ14998.1 histidine kinase [Bacillus sp. FJAT-27264]